MQFKALNEFGKYNIPGGVANDLINKLIKIEDIGDTHAHLVTKKADLFIAALGEGKKIIEEYSLILWSKYEASLIAQGTTIEDIKKLLRDLYIEMYEYFFEEFIADLKQELIT